MTRTPTLSDLRTQWRDGSLDAGDVDWLLDEVERLSGGQSHRHVMEKARAEIERLTRELAEARSALSRISPPSAPAQDGAEASDECRYCDGSGLVTWADQCVECNGTGKARR